MLKHAKESAAGPASDPSKVGGDDWNADHVVDSDGFDMVADASVPAAPSAGNVRLFGKTIAGGALPAYRGPSGLESALQPFLGRNKIGAWIPLGNSTITNGMCFGLPVPSTLGTTTARGVSTGNLFSSMRRIGYVSGASANSRALIYDNVPKWWCGDTPGLGGFRLLVRFGCSDAAEVAGARTFVGLAATSTVSNGADPSASLNIIGVGADSADTNLHIMHNDGFGIATKIDLGANFPANTMNVDVYELALFVAPNSSEVNYEVTRLNTGHVAEGVVTADLPAASQLLMPLLVRNSGPTALAVGIDLMGLYIETDA